MATFTDRKKNRSGKNDGYRRTRITSVSLYAPGELDAHRRALFTRCRGNGTGASVGSKLRKVTDSSHARFIRTMATIFESQAEQDIYRAAWLGLERKQ